MLDEASGDCAFSFFIEIDQHVAAEDHVEAAADRIRRLVEVQAGELHERADLGTRLHDSLAGTFPLEHVAAQVGLWNLIRLCD